VTRAGCLVAVRILQELFSGIAGAQPDPATLMRQARAKILESAEKLTKYTCVESVRRWRFESPVQIRGNPCGRLRPDDSAGGQPRLMPAWTDRFKLDVTVSGGVEIFSWAGAREFQTADAQAIVGEGMTGSGDFVPFLVDIFGGNPDYQFLSWETVDGRLLAAYRYQVPASASRYQVKVGSDSSNLAYEGTFWIDPQDAELRRMTIIAPRPPRKSDTCRIETEIRYQRVPISGSALLMPQATLLRLWDSDGVRHENRVEYGACRAFQSESVFRPDESSAASDSTAVAGANPPGPAAKARPIPPGMTLRIAMQSTIDSASSFAGDAIEGRLVEGVWGRDGAIVAPEGAMVRGRIVRVEEHFMPSRYLTIGLKFQSLVVAGVEMPLKLSLVSRSREEQALNSPDERRKGVGIFLSRNDRLVIDRHFVSEWTTGTPE